MLYLFSDDVNLKLNVKSTGGPSVLTEEPFFLSRKADDETERLRWRAQKPAEDLRAYNQSFSLWDLKVIQFALQHLEKARRTLNNADKRRGCEVAYLYFQWFIFIQDYVGFIQVIFFWLCVRENFRKSPSRGNTCETWMQLCFPTILRIQPIGITHLVVFTLSDESSLRSQEVILWHLTKTWNAEVK